MADIPEGRDQTKFEVSGELADTAPLQFPHVAGTELVETGGAAFTKTAVAATSLHPFASVTTTVYDVVTDGQATGFGEVGKDSEAPGLQM